MIDKYFKKLVESLEELFESNIPEEEAFTMIQDKMIEQGNSILYVKYIMNIIENSETTNYTKTKYLAEVTKIAYAYTDDIEFAKLNIKKALEYADIGQMYGIAGDCYRETGDKDFSTKLYKKTIKKCLKTNNTSRLHLLCQSMGNIDMADDDYFYKWGEKVKAKAKKLNEKTKRRETQNNIECTYDTQKINKVELSEKKFLKKAKEFFNTEIQENEIFYVIKAFIDDDEKVQSRCVYYGIDMSPLDFLVNSSDDSEEVFLAEVTSQEAFLKFINSSKKNAFFENIYIFRVIYKDFQLSKIKSFYSGKHELNVYIFNDSDEVLKRFGKVDYSPSLNFF